MPSARPSDGVDGEIAPAQILFEGDLRSKFHGEAAVARRDLALEARQRVFLVGLRMQEDREFAPHFAKIVTQQLFTRCADHDPVALFHGQAQQAVSNRTANQIHLHG